MRRLGDSYSLCANGAVEKIENLCGCEVSRVKSSSRDEITLDTTLAHTLSSRVNLHLVPFPHPFRPGAGGLTLPKKPKAKRFSPIALITEERAAELREVLREMLIEFLELCRQLVLKTRTVLNVPKSVPGVIPAPRAAGEERTPEEVIFFFFVTIVMRDRDAMFTTVVQ